MAEAPTEYGVSGAGKAAVSSLAELSAMDFLSGEAAIMAVRAAADAASQAGVDAADAAATAQAAVDELAVVVDRNATNVVIPVSDDPDVAVVITDETGGMSWMQAGWDGGPTQAARAAIGVEQHPGETNGIMFAVIGDDGSRTWLEADATGGPTPYAASLIAAALGAPAAPPKLIHTIGHSFTSDGSIAGRVASLLGGGWTGTTSGVGGEQSSGIAARAGACPWYIHPQTAWAAAGSPTPVTLDLGGSNVEYWPLTWNSDASNSTLGTGQNNDLQPGIRGDLHFSDGTTVAATLHITRPAGTVGGAAHLAGDVYSVVPDVACPALPRPLFRPSYVRSQLGGVVLLMVAQNNITDLARVQADLRALVRLVGHDRFLVIGEWAGVGSETGTTYGNAIAAFNTWAAAEFGPRFVETHHYAMTYGLSQAGITPTSGDTADIAAGIVPRSLRKDGLHPTNTGWAGWDAICVPTVQTIRALGWA